MGYPMSDMPRGPLLLGLKKKSTTPLQAHTAPVLRDASLWE